MESTLNTINRKSIRRLTFWFNTFLFMCIAHYIEHLSQMFQLYILGMPRKECLGFLGMAYPWLVKSEWLHFSYALAMLIGFILWSDYLVFIGRRWWKYARNFQFYHVLEHIILLAQALVWFNLLNSPSPISFGQLFLPRIELHFIYSSVVLIFMFIALINHYSYIEKTSKITINELYKRLDNIGVNESAASDKSAV